MAEADGPGSLKRFLEQEGLTGTGIDIVAENGATLSQ